MDAYPNNKFCQDLLKITEAANSQGNDTAWGMGWNRGRRFQCIYRLIFWVDSGQEPISVARQPLKLQTLVELHKAWRRRDVIGGLILTYRSHKPSVPILIAIIVSLSKTKHFRDEKTKQKKVILTGVSYHSATFGVLLSKWGVPFNDFPKQKSARSSGCEIFDLILSMPVVEETLSPARQRRNAAGAHLLAGIPR